MNKITLRKVSLAPLDTRSIDFAIDYEHELNDAQYEAVSTVNGPLLIIAGAGTGKTRTLTYRVARLIECGVQPESILLLTFTRKSSQEMLRRAALLLDVRTEKVSGGTFHSFANGIMRRYASLIGFQSSFTILDQSDAEDVINLLRTRAGFESKGRRFPKKQTLHDMFSMAVNTITPLDLILAKEYPQFVDLYDSIFELHKMYVGYKRQNFLMDYDDLLIHLVHLLEQQPELRKKLGAEYKYIMVDEYQDTNSLQARIVKLLGEAHQNVMVVGDDSQSIYSFRGANFRNVMDFPKEFPAAKIVKLEENFRSTQPILDLANAIIDRASEKYTKVLYTKRSGGEAPAVVEAANENMQSRFIVQKILELREEGVALEEIAVLFRAAYLSFDLEIELTKANIPYVKFGGLKFIETAHVKDMIAYLRVLENPKDIVAWNRILLLIEGIGPRTAERITDEILHGRLTLGSSSKARLAQLVKSNDVEALFEMLHSISRETLAPADKTEIILQYYRPILKARYDDYPKRLKDLDMFQSIAERYRTVQSLLTDLALEPPNESVSDLMASGKEEEFVTLSTIHSAKGLEWHSVFLIHVLDGRFPGMNAASSDAEMEEERRLMYVACTRAKQNLFLSYPINMYDRSTGTVLSKPSRFIEGLPPELLESFIVEEEE